MPTFSAPLAQSTVLGIPFIPLVTDIFFGILGLIIILIFHGSCINKIIMRFERRTDINLKLDQYNRVFIHFYASFFFIALVHICEIILWSFYLLSLGLMSDGVQALLFAGSCYTTVGFVADTLPFEWKSLAFLLHLLDYFLLLGPRLS